MSEPDPPAQTGAGPLRRDRRARRRRRVASRVLLAVAAAVTAGALVVVAPWDAGRRQAIADQVTVWLNAPSEEIVALADATAMTEEGRRIFFATTPALEDATTFGDHCPVESAAVLGCYAAGEIYIYRVTDARLPGTNEVTAAHELLHAAYERLGDEERRRVDALIDEYVADLPEDDDLFEVLAGYAPRQHADELHSRLGTERDDLPTELEEHYARYFLDRTVVLALAADATAAFDEVLGRINELVAELDALAAAHESASERYERDLAALEADIDAFNRRADAGDFRSQAQFDSERAALIARSDALEAERMRLNQEVERYNALVAELESLDATYADLYGSLDPRQAPPPSSDPAG